MSKYKLYEVYECDGGYTAVIAGMAPPPLCLPVPVWHKVSASSARAAVRKVLTRTPLRDLRGEKKYVRTDWKGFKV